MARRPPPLPPLFTRAALALLASALCATAQTPPPPRRVPPPRAMANGSLGNRARRRTPPPPVRVIDDPEVALVIDGERIDRRAYGEALIREYGLRYLETFVRNHLVRTRARALGVTVSADAIEAEVRAREQRVLFRRYRGERRAMERALADLGLRYEDWRAGLRRHVERELLTEALVRAERDISEPTLRKHYQARYGPDGARRTVRDIVLFTDLWRSPRFSEKSYRAELPEIIREAERRADALHRQLLAGADFATLARRHSDDPMAPKGGDYGPFWRNRFGDAIDRTIEKTPIGQPTPVMHTARGFVIALPYGEREGWEYRARHILLSTRLSGKVDPAFARRHVEQAREKAKALLAELRAGADFATLARQHSDDPATRNQGGDLGRVFSGQLDPALEAALRRLEPGRFGGPVETAFGIHVLQLLEKHRRPERDERLVRVILISTEYLKVKQRRLGPRLRELVERDARSAIARLEAGEDPDALVRALSEDPRAATTGGLLRAPLPPDTDPAVRAAIARLDPEHRVARAQGKHALHILWLESFERRSFEEAKAALIEEIRAAPVTAAQTREYLERLRRNATVERGPMG